MQVKNGPVQGLAALAGAAGGQLPPNHTGINRVIPLPHNHIWL
jgi:hypothetical protein